MQSSPTTRARQRQMRSFVIAWLGVTLLMGVLTFVGIYYATGIVNAENSSSDNVDDNIAALPNAEVESAPVDDAALDPAADQADEPQADPVTDVDTAADADSDAAPVANDSLPLAPAAMIAPQAQAAEPTVTPIPVQDQRFQLGIQVEPNADPSVFQIWVGEVRDKLRLGWIKQQVRWEHVEPEPGQYNWAELDAALSLASESNIKVMLSVVTAPDWAREPGNQRLDEVGPPGNPQDYANFLINLIYRYPGQIHAIEVWNEMNIDREWASIYGLSAQNYVTLLQTAYNAIKTADSHIIVISGALSPTGVNDGVTVYDDFVYMDMLIQAGLLNTVDCVGAHHNGYNIGPNVAYNNVPNDPTATFRGPFDNPNHSWSFYSTLNGYAQRIQQAGSTKPICVTEFGWATTEDLDGTPVGFEFANDNTLAEQAQFIDDAIQLMDGWGYMWLAFIWNLNYGAPAWDPTNDNVPYALLRPDWIRSPAYDVIAAYDFVAR